MIVISSHPLFSFRSEHFWALIGFFLIYANTIIVLCVCDVFYVLVCVNIYILACMQVHMNVEARTVYWVVAAVGYFVGSSFFHPSSFFPPSFSTP